MSKKNILILTEGIADITFLRDYLLYLNPKLKQKEKQIKKELTLTDEIQKIRIKAIGGYTNLLNEKTEMEQYYDQDYEILVIQDTDDPEKNHGGLEERMIYLSQISKDINIKFHTFLFPNNNHDGDLETLLLNIVNNTKFVETNKCYIDFISQERKLDLGFIHELENNKSVIFNYFRAHFGIEKAKETNRVYTCNYWDFSSTYLNELNTFFRKTNTI